MTIQYILPLADRQAVLEKVGGKGTSLARLASAGLPVPGGFHITTDAYRQFVAANELQLRLLAALEPLMYRSPPRWRRLPDNLSALHAVSHPIFHHRCNYQSIS
jgi:pyruvate,water dikinase